MTFSQANIDVPRLRIALVLFLTGSFALTACGGGGASLMPRGASTMASAGGGSLQNARVTLTIRIPASPASASTSKARAAYISTAIQSIDFRLTGVTPTGGGTYTGALNADTLVLLLSGYGSSNCTADLDGDKTCTATTSAPAPATDTWTIYTYATFSPVVGTTAPLSIYTGYSLPITVAGPNNASVATWGVPASLAFSPATVALVPNVTATVTTSLQAKDAGGATLIGAENFATAAGTASTVNFTGCDAHLTPSPATLTAANPAALAG